MKNNEKQYKKCPTPPYDGNLGACEIQDKNPSSCHYEAQQQFECRSNPGGFEVQSKGNGLPREPKMSMFARNDVKNCQIQDKNQTSRHYEAQYQFECRSNPGEREAQSKDNGLPREHKKSLFARNDAAFTLAEVLITLVIIGIIAAVTLPMVNQNTQNKEYNTARLKARASIGEAFRTMSTNGVISADITTENFVKTIIPKYLKLDKTCATARECGFPEKIKRPDGVEVDVQTTWMGETDNRAYGVEIPAVTSTDLQQLLPEHTIQI